MIKKKLTVLGVVFFILIFFPGWAYPDDETEEKIVSLGMAAGKTPGSRDEALNDALRQAVMQGVGTYISSETTVEQMQLVEDRIYSTSRGYIKHYNILHEGLNEGIYEVKISAVVKMGKLADDLESIGLVIEKKKDPRVMVVIYSKERLSSYSTVLVEGNRNVENQIESMLMKMGFKLVDADQIQRKKKLEAFLLQGNPAGASKIAKDFGAEILVEGVVRRAFVNQRRIMGRNMRFFTNDINLKAIETDTAKVLFSGYRSRSPSGESALLPLEEASEELGEEMIAGILDQWRKDVFQAGTYHVNLSEVSFQNISIIKEELLKIRGVSDVQVRNYQSKIANLEVKFQGPIEKLAEKISQIKTLSLKIVGLQSNTLEIAFSH